MSFEKEANEGRKFGVEVVPATAAPLTPEQLIEQNKQSAIGYVRSDIAMLSEQTDDGERRAYHHRANAGLHAIRAGGLITLEELRAIGDEIGAANEQAVRQVLAAQR